MQQLPTLHKSTTRTDTQSTKNDMSLPAALLLEWLSAVGLQPLVEELVEATCIALPDRFYPFALGWLKAKHPEAAAKATTTWRPCLGWKKRRDVEASSQKSVESYLHEVGIEDTVDSLIHSAACAQPEDVVAYLVDELSRLQEMHYRE